MNKRFSLTSVFILLAFCASNLAAESKSADRPTARKLVHLAPKLSSKVATLATNALNCAAVKSNLDHPQKLAIIDYSIPSTEKRFWLFDLMNSKLLIEDLVAHGKNSGDIEAESFSNTPGSLQSSLGLFRVGERYFGKHGDSLRLIGLEPGFNDLAYERAIVIHGADYVSQSFIKLHQRLGRSFGCPALSPSSNQKVIEALSNGLGVLFSYYPDKSWLNNSDFTNNCSPT